MGFTNRKGEGDPSMNNPRTDRPAETGLQGGAAWHVETPPQQVLHGGGGNQRVIVALISVLIGLLVLVGAGGLGYYMGRQSAAVDRIERAAGMRALESAPAGRQGLRTPERIERRQDFFRAEDTEVLKGTVTDLKDGSLAMTTARGDVEVVVRDNTTVLSESGIGGFDDIGQGDTLMVFAEETSGEGTVARGIVIIPSD